MKIKKLIQIGAFISVLLLGGFCVSQATFINKMFSLSIQLLQPSHRFDKANMVDELNYSEEEHWASLPQIIDESDLLPEALTKSLNDGTAPVDVFYIHGTGYTNGEHWTSPLKENSATTENTRFSLANEASIFNTCCNIFAPQYREASIFTYISTNRQERERIMAAVYPDIARAFKYYLQYLNQGRPFVIVSHSQGTHHAMRLVKEVIDNSVIAEKMVVAYLIGGIVKPVTYQYIDSLKNITACSKAGQLGCVIHWDTYGEGGEERMFKSQNKALCTNPLTWTTGSKVATKENHLGAASIVGEYTMKFYGSDEIEPIDFSSQAEITPRLTKAQCRDGALYVNNLSETEYSKLGSMKDNNYHGINFPLFHMNIRKNVQLRIDNYLNKSKVNKEVK